jgi:Protein of unknown function (DUF3352)
VRPVRRLLAAAISVCLLAAAPGCGGDDASSGPLEAALSYVPGRTPFVVAIDTDLEGDQYKSLQAILDRFPGGVKLDDLFAGQLDGGSGGVSFEKDVKPLLGNPFVVSATDVTSFLSDTDDDFVAVLEVKDTEALGRLIDKTKPDKQGQVAGATVYDDDGTVFAVAEDTVVFAGSRERLEAALKRADAGEGMDPSSFENGLEGLPEEALARAFFDVRALLDQDPGAQDARKVEWVRALRTLGMTASVEDDSADIEFNLKADGDLSDEDLPLAAGDSAPSVLQREGEIGIGVRDPSQIVTFFESALGAVEPQTFGDYQAGKQAISQRYGVDLDKDLFGQLTEDMSVSVAIDGSFGARAEVKDPKAFADTVDKAARALPQLGSGLGVTRVRRVGELYEGQLADGRRIFFGMRNGAFVVASDRARALELGTQQPTEVDGAEGSLVMAADAEQVGLRLIQQLGPQLGAGGVFGGGLFARPLDRLSGSASSSTDGMRGRFSLALD